MRPSALVLKFHYLADIHLTKYGVTGIKWAKKIFTWQFAGKPKTSNINYLLSVKWNQVPYFKPVSRQVLSPVFTIVVIKESALRKFRSYIKERKRVPKSTKWNDSVASKHLQFSSFCNKIFFLSSDQTCFRTAFQH